MDIGTPIIYYNLPSICIETHKHTHIYINPYERESGGKEKVSVTGGT